MPLLRLALSIYITKNHSVHICSKHFSYKLANLEVNFNRSCNWFDLRKHIFSITKKNLYLYFKVFFSIKFSSYFSNISFHLLHYRTTTKNYIIRKKFNFFFCKSRKSFRKCCRSECFEPNFRTLQRRKRKKLTSWDNNCL